jgi:hypothetical protein
MEDEVGFGLLADDVRGWAGAFGGEPAGLEGVLPVGRFLKARDKEHIGRLGGLGVAVLEEVASILEDFAAGWIVIG